MPLFRYTITPLSAFGTPLRSDTLHGHLLCAAGELDGPDAVRGLIARFESGSPPFVCSSALPRGFLPMPCLPPIARRSFRKRFVGSGGGRNMDEFQALTCYKRFRKLEFIPLAVWMETRSGMSLANLFERWLEDQKVFRVSSAPGSNWAKRHHLEAHNSMDRTTGSVLQEGGLYLSEVDFYGKETRLDLYVRTEEVEAFERLLTHIRDTGFGRDRSTGKGAFTFGRDTGFDASSLDAPHSHRMSLSVLAAEDMRLLATGWYSTFAKHGKVWDGFGQTNPFKRPFLALGEGSVFREMPDGGYVLHGLHPDPGIVQVTWPLTVPLTVRTEEA